MKDQEVVEMALGVIMKQTLRLGEQDCKILNMIELQRDIILELVKRIEKLEASADKLMFRES